MSSMQLRFQETGIQFIPQYKYLSDDPEKAAKAEWKNFVYGKHVEKTHYLGVIGAHLGAIQQSGKRFWGECTWYFRDTKEVYFLNRVLVCTWLAAVQEFYRGNNITLFESEIKSENESA